MGRYAIVSAAVKSLLENNIDRVGVIFSEWPYVTEWNDMLLNHTTAIPEHGEIIKVIIIDRERGEDAWAAIRQTHLNETWALHCWFGFESKNFPVPGTGPSFQDWVDELLAALRSDYRIDDNFDTRVGPISEMGEPRTYGDVLCHYAKITFTGEKDYTF